MRASTRRMFNRVKLGRTLDEAHAYGCDLLLSELALAVCAQEGIDSRFHHLDPTSFALSGEDVPASDEPAIRMTHGYSKDHRPDLKQAVLERMVSPDGGVPLVRKRWEGKAADTQMFRERAEALLATLKISPTPRSLVADSKLYHEDHAANLSQFGFITRLPNPLKLVAPVIQQALTGDTWQRRDETTGDHRIELGHDGMAQRWLVVSSQAALERAEATVSNACQREAEAIDKPLFHLQAKRFETPEAAQAELATRENAWTDHQLEAYGLLEHQHDAGKGRPTPATPITSIDWQIQAQVRPEQEKLAYHQQGKAGCVVGTNIEAEPLSAAEVMVAYTGQSQAEGGFRLLKDPLFFVSSLFGKPPCRIQGLLMVMTCALLVSSVMPRRLRHQLARQGETMPNQIHQPTERPTLRWLFQLLDGIHRLRVTVHGKVYDLIEGLNEVQINILRLFGDAVCQLYQIAPA